jgi:hypothetical protein
MVKSVYFGDSEVRVVGAGDADDDLRSEWRCDLWGEIILLILIHGYYEIALKSLPNQSEHSVALF